MWSLGVWGYWEKQRSNREGLALHDLTLLQEGKAQEVPGEEADMLVFHASTQVKSCPLKPVGIPGALERTPKLRQAACFLQQGSEAQGEKLAEEQAQRGRKTGE